MKRLTWISATLLLATNAFARPPHHGPKLDEAIVEQAVEAGIDTSTVDRIVALAEAAEPALKSSHDEARAAHESMRDLLGADVPDRAAILRQASVEADAQLAARLEMIELELQIRELLTPEQWETVRPAPPDMRGGRGPHR